MTGTVGVFGYEPRPVEDSMDEGRLLIDPGSFGRNSNLLLTRAATSMPQSLFLQVPLSRVPRHAVFNAVTAAPPSLHNIVSEGSPLSLLLRLLLLLFCFFVFFFFVCFCCSFSCVCPDLASMRVPTSMHSQAGHRTPCQRCRRPLSNSSQPIEGPCPLRPPFTHSQQTHRVLRALAVALQPGKGSAAMIPRTCVRWAGGWIAACWWTTRPCPWPCAPTTASWCPAGQPCNLQP